MVDTIAILQIHSEKFNMCSCQGLGMTPPQNPGDDIFRFLTLHGTLIGAARFISIQSNLWLSHSKCLYVFVAQIF